MAGPHWRKVVERLSKHSGAPSPAAQPGASAPAPGDVAGEMPLRVEVLRARGLPRLHLLRAPDAYVEVYAHPGAPPSATSAVAPRGCAPEWDAFACRVAVPPAAAPPLTVGIVVRDAGSRGAVAGRAYLRVAASLTQGWFPLTADAPPADASAAADWEPPRDDKAYVHPEAEVFVRVEWPEYCSLPHAMRVASPAIGEADGNPESELRMTSPEPGRFFRCGEMIVNVRALGVPASLKDSQLVVKTGDQTLRGYEITSPASSAVDDAMEPLFGGGGPGGSYDYSADSPNRADGEDPVENFRPVLSKAEYRSAKNSGVRRNVDFGSFSFALFQGTFPDKLHLSLRDRGSRNAFMAKLMSVSDQKIELPSEIPGIDGVPRTSSNLSRSSAGRKSSNSVSAAASSSFMDLIRRSVMGADPSADPDGSVIDDYDEESPKDFVIQMRLAPPGDPAAKVVFSIRVSYTLWQPTASCHVVTPRFRELMDDVDSLIEEIPTKYPELRNLSYLFVGGFFTDHYPKYYEHGKEFLTNTLNVADYQTVPIHTERSVEENSKVIRDSVMSAAKREKSVVLIGHSKGGVDVCAAIARYPELAPKLFGFISFQSPFGGTFLIDFLARRRMAAKGLESALKLLWSGEMDSFLDMGYGARLRHILFGTHNAVADSVRQARDAVQDVAEEVSGEAAQIRAAGLAREEVAVLDDAHVAERLRAYAEVPAISFGSTASFAVTKVRTIANAAGFASMSPLALAFSSHTGFNCDGLVAGCDARIPYSDLVQLPDMMHTEPALYFPGSKYPPGKLTAVALVLLCEKIDREAACD